MSLGFICIIYSRNPRKQQEILYDKQLQWVHTFAMVQHTSLNEISAIYAQPTSRLPLGLFDIFLAPIIMFWILVAMHSNYIDVLNSKLYFVISKTCLYNNNITPNRKLQLKYFYCVNLYDINKKSCNFWSFDTLHGPWDASSYC